MRQLNADLVKLGYATRSEIDPSSDYFDSATAYALERLHAHIGADQTGSLNPGEAVFLPTPLRITQVNVSQPSAALTARAVGGGGSGRS